MNLELFIARKLHFNSDDSSKSIISPTIRIAIAGISIGLMVMILAVAIVLGFKKEIRDKVIGFGSHIQISNFNSNSTFETAPISFPDSIRDIILSDDNVNDLCIFATKPGVIKTNEDFLSIVMKGVDSKYDFDFFKRNLVRGEIPAISDSTYSNQVIISAYIADKMHLDVNDDFISYFIKDDIKARKFKVSGIYKTNFNEYDKIFVLGDIKHVIRLNGWDSDQASGAELTLKEYSLLDDTVDELYSKLSNRQDSNNNSYFIRSIEQLNPQIFSWLDVLDINVWIILILMGVVSAFTMISGLLVIILERTNMIGILKAMGMSNVSIRKIFIYISLFIIGKGLIIGNIIALFICFIQKYTGIIKLDPENYELDAVPILINYWYILLLNIGTVLLSLIILLGPSFVISKMNPVKSIKFE